jgi:NAD(P)H-dependent FMN reductase
MHAPSYIVIAGSTRPNRRSPIIAQWIAELGEQETGAPFRVVDLRDLGLKFDDESGIPALHEYACETTRAWGGLVSGAAGVVIVTPQYNWGYPAVLKNAIDHLFREWQGKPVRRSVAECDGWHRRALDRDDARPGAGARTDRDG